MKNYFLGVMVILIFSVLIGVFLVKDSTIVTEGSIRNDSPSDSLKLFFDKSSVGDESVKDLITTHPNQYFECIYETPEECKIKREKNKEISKNTKNSPNVAKGISLGTREISILVRAFSKGIKEQKVTLTEIKNEWIKNDEARVRVYFVSNGRNYEKDFLLFKENDKWKLFEIIEKDDDINFASPVSKSTDEFSS
jgi:hypothetical protein